MAGRKKNPWGQRLGLPSATIDRLAQGGNVGGDVLAIVCRVENASISWLLEGKGAPYLVQRATSDAEAAALLEALLDDESGWSVYQVEDSGQRMLLVLTLPARFERKGTWIDYTIVEVIAGELGHETRAALNNSNAEIDRHWLSIDDITARRLATGRLGTWQLVGDTEHPGILQGAPTGMREEIPKYHAGISSEARHIARWYDNLPEPSREAFRILFGIEDD